MNPVGVRRVNHLTLEDQNLPSPSVSHWSTTVRWSPEGQMLVVMVAMKGMLWRRWLAFDLQHPPRIEVVHRSDDGQRALRQMLLHHRAVFHDLSGSGQDILLDRFVKDLTTLT